MREIIETVESCTEIATHPRHAYAGELVFTAFSGSHQDAIRKCLVKHDADPAKAWEVAYLPIDPRDLGRRYEEVIRINSQSGKGGVLHVIERDLRITLPRWLQIDFSRVVQTLAEQQGGEVSPASIHALFDATYVAAPDAWRLGEYDVHKTEDGVRTQVTLGDGTHLTGRGRGMVAAFADALATSLGVTITVEAFDEMALDAGTDARAWYAIPHAMQPRERMRRMRAWAASTHSRRPRPPARRVIHRRPPAPHWHVLERCGSGPLCGRPREHNRYALRRASALPGSPFEACAVAGTRSTSEGPPLLRAR
jgi:hypothetical protein